MIVVMDPVEVFALQLTSTILRAAVFAGGEVEGSTIAKEIMNLGAGYEAGMDLLGKCVEGGWFVQIGARYRLTTMGRQAACGRLQRPSEGELWC